MTVASEVPPILCGVDEQADCQECDAESTPRNPVFRVAIVGAGFKRLCRSCLRQLRAEGGA